MAFDLDESCVLEAEEKLGARLPASYRAAMMKHNGGSLAAGDEDWELFPVLDTRDRRRLARTCNDILGGTGAFAEWAGFPASALAIATNGEGDCIVFLRAGTAFDPAPFLWRHATRELARIAGDFEAPAGQASRGGASRVAMVCFHDDDQFRH